MNETNIKASKPFEHRFNIKIYKNLKMEFAALCDEYVRHFAMCKNDSVHVNPEQGVKVADSAVQKRDKEIYRRYLEGESMVFLGREYGVSRQRVGQIVQECKNSGLTYAHVAGKGSKKSRGSLYRGRLLDPVVRCMITEAIRLGKLPFDTKPYYNQSESNGGNGPMDATLPVRMPTEQKDEFARICKIEGFTMASAIRFYVSQCVEKKEILVLPDVPAADA